MLTFELMFVESESVPSSLTSCWEQRTLHHEVLSKTQMSSEQVVHCQAISDHGNHLSSFRLLLLAACLSVVRKSRGYLRLTRLLFAFQSTPSGISEGMLADHRQLPLNLFDAILIYSQCEPLERAHTAVQFSETCTNSFWSGCLGLKRSEQEGWRGKSDFFDVLHLYHLSTACFNAVCPRPQECEADVC